MSPEKTEFIEKEVAYHMGILARGFASGEFKEDCMANMDETRFIINMDNCRTLGFRGDDNVKYADVVSGTTGMTMVVLLSGGTRSNICPPCMIFINKDSNYPIRGVPDDVTGVSYRTAKKGFMPRDVKYILRRCLQLG